MYVRILFLIFISFALSQGSVLSRKFCGIDVTTNNRIVGGTETSLRQYPWLGLIEYRDRTSGKPVEWLSCGASLITLRHVITAAHCDKYLDRSGIKDLEATAIRLGDYNRTNPGKDCVQLPRGLDCTTSLSIRIKSIIVHPKFDIETLDNDIALITLENVAPYTDNIRPICLPVEDFTKTAPSKLSLTVAGWGVYAQLWHNGEYDFWNSEVKRYTSVLYWPNEICKLVKPKITSHQICAGGVIDDACKGDSGGPLMYNRDGVYELVGVVSGGENYPCGQRGKPGYYTKVYDYMKWIKENLY